jgi:DNA-binding CsgD family transcriptional regulator
MDAGDHSVVLYTESQLRLRDDAPQGGTPSLVGRLRDAATAAQREALVRQALRQSGFEWLAYGAVSQCGGRSEPTSFLTTYAHPAWTPHYFAERYHEVDRRHQEAPKSSLPMVWDVDDIDGRAPAWRGDPRSRRFVDDFRASGIGSGLFFRLASPASADEHTVISLLSSNPDRRWIADPVLGQALALGLCLHEFISRHLQPPTPIVHLPRGSCLSALQQEILQCLRRGQSDKQIAYGLHLSSHAVDYHMRQLRRRFSVRNRVQLVNAAM